MVILSSPGSERITSPFGARSIARGSPSLSAKSETWNPGGACSVAFAGGAPTEGGLPEEGVAYGFGNRSMRISWCCSNGSFETDTVDGISPEAREQAKATAATTAKRRFMQKVWTVAKAESRA